MALLKQRCRSKKWKINERAIRFVFKNKHIKYDNWFSRHFKANGSLKLYHLYFLSLAQQLRATMDLNRELISFREVHNILRGTNILTLPKPKTTSFGVKLRSYLGAKLWNVIPDSQRTN